METPLISTALPLIIAAGIRFAPLSMATSAFLRLASDPTINGRCLVAAPDRVFDVRDDFEGLDGGVEMRNLAREGNVGEELAKRAWGKEKREEVGNGVEREEAGVEEEREEIAKAEVVG